MKKQISVILFICILAICSILSYGKPYTELNKSKNLISVSTKNDVSISSLDDIDKLDNYIYELEQPPTEEEKARIELFDPKNLNYTALRMEIDELVDDLNTNGVNRQGKFLGRKSGMPSILSNIRQALDFDQIVREVETSLMSSMSCSACKTGVALLQSYLTTYKAKDEMIKAAAGVCRTFKIETPRVCHGIINLMADEVLYVAQRVYMTPDEVCGFLIGSACGNFINPYHDWSVEFPNIPKPPVDLTYSHRGTDGRPLKVLQLSDTHFDPDYAEGSNAECGEPMCCRLSSGRPKDNSAAAGYWGDYRKCDTPKRTIYSMLEHITTVHPDIDYIIWTGDLPPHDVWNQTKESNIHVIEETVNQLVKFFPHIPIFPALGNHEAVPVNSFPPAYVPDQFRVNWLYKELQRMWSHWLPENTAATIRKGGFYSTLVRPELRIISINTNFCNNKNWWLLVNSTDPTQELQWLIYELQGAELRKEKVHIIGHIPPGHPDCLKIWSKNYYLIINRYESTIAAQFFGHTHYDEFEVFYDLDHPSRAINIAYVAPSVTTFTKLNPGYRIYTIGPNRMVMDHETWIADLAEANQYGTLGWFKLYSVRNAYRMNSLEPKEWDSLVLQMTKNKQLFDAFYRNYWKASYERDFCDSDCKKRILCDLKSGRSHDRDITCSDVMEKLEAEERNGWGGWLFSGLTVGGLATWWFWG